MSDTPLTDSISQSIEENKASGGAIPLMWLTACRFLERELTSRLNEARTQLNIERGEVERHKTRMARVVELEQEVERLRGLQVE